MKSLTAVTTIALSTLFLTSCGYFGEQYNHEETGVQPVVEEVTVPTTTPEVTRESDLSDIDSQLTLITGKYTDLYEDYVYDEIILPNTFFAITDHNHNGRLEVLLTSCTGSCAISYTMFYEISEDYTDLVQLKFADGYAVDFGDEGDFCDWRTDQAIIQVYDCYMKNGVYYYLVDDYASAGWSDKYIGYYSYSFGKTVRKDIIGTVSIYIPEGEYTIKTQFGNSSKNSVNEDEYFENVNSYWDGYEKQKSCEVKWFLFRDEAEFADNVKDSWEAFNPDSEKSSDVTFDYRAYFGSFYGDEYEFEVQE